MYSSREGLRVRVERDGTDSEVPDCERAGACPELDAVVKAEDMEVPCKMEPTGAAGSLTNTSCACFRSPGVELVDTVPYLFVDETWGSESAPVDVYRVYLAFVFGGSVIG